MFGIHNLSPKHQATNPAGLYMTTARNSDISINYLKTLLKSNDTNTFISFEDLPTLLKNLTQQTKNELKHLFQKQKTFFISKNKSHLHLDKLSDDLDKIQFKHGSSVVIYIPDQPILLSKNKLRVNFFKYLNKLARVKQLHISIVGFGQENHTLNHWLMEHPELFLGISTLHKVERTKYVYQIHYWFSDGEITANYEYDVIQMKNQDFSVDLESMKSLNDEVISTHDGHFIHISEIAIDSNQHSEQTMIKYADNQALFNEIDKINTGIMVLSINQQSEVHNIAVQVYRLRHQFGFKFKVVIREMQQCLRYSDESFLSHAGINLIVPSSVRYPRFLSMVETLQKQEVNCIIPDSIDELLSLETNVGFGQKGYVNNQPFVSRCHQLIQQYEQTKLQFALIKLTLLPGIDVNSCLSMCHIKRDGDLITACSDALYVLLSSVRENDVQIALNHIFKLPIMDMFQSNTIYTTPGRIKAQLPEIVTQAVSINENAASLASTGSHYASNREEENQTHELAYATHKPLEF
ncbi:cellulose biosynthesis protein BcsE [Vibrio rumoiensis]|uniref:Cellulose biosynthesis protein BcsE n=1 Tax=Vibrio rumoiensis 1S-45 TaxID=1188252 RepID=A0A1E5E5M6_9VIBR|nr:cellulose biosynthesis protein BcsE [Vibrio rumoiensis]OEF28969.1 cellulose biosynthesis protein BcsE [Vibrio rumoiensis 1S-45]